MVNNFDDFRVRAIVPEQLPHYVQAVSLLSPIRLGSYLAWQDADNLVMVAFPDSDPPWSEQILQDLDTEISDLLPKTGLNQVTILAPIKPSLAPAHAQIKSDAYWCLPIPVKLKSKDRSLINSAAKQVDIVADSWTRSHSGLRDSAMLRMRGYGEDNSDFEYTAAIFANIPAYLESDTSSVILYSAYRHSITRPCAIAIADFSSWSTVFYMFAFRSKDAPPGTADLLINSIITEGIRRGQRRCNLGLGIQPSLVHFKQKWRSEPIIPYVETSWIAKQSIFSKLFNIFKG